MSQTIITDKNGDEIEISPNRWQAIQILEHIMGLINDKAGKDIMKDELYFECEDAITEYLGGDE